MDTRLHVTLLPPRFIVAKVQGPENLRKCAYGLIKCMLTRHLSPPAQEECRIFGLTQAGDEITLILSDEDLEHFPADALITTEVRWRALQVSGEGSLGFGTYRVILIRIRYSPYSSLISLLSWYLESIGIVQSISAPLASTDISIFYVSTYETDFFLVRLCFSFYKLKPSSK